MTKLILSLTTLSALVVFSMGQNVFADAEKVKAKTKEAVDATKEYSFEKKAEFETKIREEMTELDKKIDGLSHKAKSESNDQLAKIRARRAELENKLSGVSKSSSEAWTEVKSGVVSALQNLEASLKKAKSKFK